jgi:predicted transcriptional regulator
MLSTINESGVERATKTSIMYKSFLSYAQLKEYLSFLLEKGLIDEIPQQIKTHGNEKLVYKITGKGIRLLQLLIRMVYFFTEKPRTVVIAKMCK